MRQRTVSTALSASIPWVSLLLGPTPASGDAVDIQVVFRYDDFSNTTPLEFDRQVIEAFGSRGMSATFGVIPFERERLAGEPYYGFPQKVHPLRPEKAELLAGAIRQGTVEVALHGYIHVEISEERPWSEFAGLPIHQQRRKISEGKRSLEELLPTEVSAFVPPFSTYDGNTLRVLEEEGFRILSAGGLDVPPGGSPLGFLPNTCEMRLLQTRDAVLGARRSGQPTAIVVVMCHPYEFLDIDRKRGVTTLADFEKLLDWLAAQDDIRVCSLGEAVEEAGPNLSLAHYRGYCGLQPYKPMHLLPAWLQEGCARVYYYPTPERLAAIKSSRRLRVAGLYAAILLIAAVVTAVVLGFASRLTALAAWASAVLLVGLAALVLPDREVYFPGAAAVAGLAGVCLGTWTRYLTRRRRAESPASHHSDAPGAPPPQPAETPSA